MHNALIQLLNNSEKEKTVCRPAGERIGWVKLRCQNELSHREKRSVPHVDRHFHLECSGRLEDRADGSLPIALALAYVYTSSKDTIDRLWKDTLRAMGKLWSIDNTLIPDADCVEELFPIGIVRGCQTTTTFLPRVTLASSWGKEGPEGAEKKEREGKRQSWIKREIKRVEIRRRSKFPRGIFIERESSRKISLDKRWDS